MILTCKQCGTSLDLDVGFSGGVCRCSNCGTLLSVPAGADHGTAKVRPDGPPAGSPSSGKPRKRSDSGEDFGLSSSIGISSSGLRTARPDPLAALTKIPSGTAQKLERSVASKKSADAGVSSSILRQSGREPTSPLPPVLEPPTPPQVRPRTLLPTPVAARIHQLRKNRILFWASIALIGVIAIILVIALISFFSHPDVR